MLFHPCLYHSAEIPTSSNIIYWSQSCRYKFSYHCKLVKEHRQSHVVLQGTLCLFLPEDIKFPREKKITILYAANKITMIQIGKQFVCPKQAIRDLSQKGTKNSEEEKSPIIFRSLFSYETNPALPSNEACQIVSNMQVETRRHNSNLVPQLRLKNLIF